LAAAVRAATLLASLFTLAAPEALACASCGCSLNADWGTQGLSTQGGWSADLRFDALNQNQLRSGTGRISPSAASTTANPYTGGPAEVEKFTRNRYTTLTLDYGARTWGVSLALPYIDRTHMTLGTGSDGYHPADDAYASHTHDLGDVRLIGRYFGFSPEKNWGVQFGLKLPTGHHDLSAPSIDPAAPGAPVTIDPGLQPGTGTTDLILGAFRFDNLNADWSYFTQATFQAALDMVGGYRPGNSLNLSGGLRYHGWSGVLPQLQLNARHVRADSGPTADRFATGGTLLYLTPGLLVPVADKASVYAYVQLPLYQNLRGIQLVPHAIYSVGVHYAF
jgi:hypothetical protein